MSDANDFPQPEGERSASPGRSGGTFAAWTVILVLTLLIAGAPTPTPDPIPTAGRLHEATFTLQARYLVGTASLAEEQTPEPVKRQVEAWRPESPWQQVRVAVVAGEVIGPEAALKRLEAIDPPSEADELAAANPNSYETLIRLYRDYAAGKPDAPSVTEAEQERLRERLGWFGKLALAPPEMDTPLREQVIAAARGTFYTIVGGMVLFGALGLAGFVLLVVFLSVLFTGVLPTLKPSPQHSGVYAEGFACWLALFLGLSVVGGLLFGPEAVGAIGFLSMIGSLAALAWPVARGVSWRQLREDIGWTPGRHWGLELAAGVGGYAMAIPLVLLALAVTGIALGFGNGGIEYGSAPSHPAAESLAQANWWQRVQLLLLACVIAPVVEESAFRGLLYRHLRDATARMRCGTSVLLSAVVSSVLFALLHPQGLLAVPALTGISVALAFTREWRNTLLPSMVAHGLNNAVVMAVLLTIVAG